MYRDIYCALQILSKGDIANLKRCNLKNLGNSPAYFRILAYAKVSDNRQTQRILFLMLHTKIEDSDEGYSVARALLEAGVNERQVLQLVRSGDNSVDYLKRQLVRCKNVGLNSLGKLSQYWGDNARRQLLKEFVLASTEKYEPESK